MTAIGRISRVRGFGIVFAAAMGIAAITAAAQPAAARVWVSIGVPAWSYAPPPAYGYVYSYPYAYVAPYRHYYDPPSYGYVNGLYIGGSFGRHWRHRDDDDDE